MGDCDCGNEYDKSFEVTAAGAHHTFDSFQSAIMEGSHGGGWLPWPYVNLPPRAASHRGLLRPRNFSYRLRNPFRFVLKRQIGLGDHPNDAIFRIYDGNSPDLMFLHQALASLDILALAAANRRQADHPLDRRGL